MDTIPIDNRTEYAVLGGVIAHPKTYDKVVPYIVSGDVFVQSRAKQLWKKISGILFWIWGKRNFCDTGMVQISTI